jgi:hypothetical protein
MKFLLLTLAMTSGATSAFALTRTTSLTCQNAANLVASQGSVILATSENEYDKYVKSGFYCDSGERPVSAWVPTRDSAACFIGYTCQEREGK